MGSFLEFTDENVKPYTTREQNFDEEFIKNPDNEDIIEYYNFCKGLIFVDGKSIKVNVDQKFAVEYLANHTILLLDKEKILLLINQKMKQLN